MSDTHTPTWTLGDRIRKARETAGYASQAELASAAGISRATVSNAENGRHTPHPLADTQRLVEMVDRGPMSAVPSVA